MVVIFFNMKRQIVFQRPQRILRREAFGFDHEMSGIDLLRATRKMITISGA